MEGCADQDSAIKASTNSLHVHRGPMQVTLNRLIEKIWTENAIQDESDDELGLERRQGIVGIIQAIG